MSSSRKCINEQLEEMYNSLNNENEQEYNPLNNEYVRLKKKYSSLHDKNKQIKKSLEL